MESGGGQILQQAVFFGLLVLGLYLLAIRPQRARARQLAQVRASLAVGSRVMTTAGIHATVLETGGEHDTVVLEVAPGVPVRFATAAVVQVVDGDGAGAQDSGT